MTIYGFFPSAAAVFLKLLLAWKTSPVCRKNKQPPPIQSSLLAENVHLSARGPGCALFSQFRFSYRLLEWTINLKEPDVSPKHPICLSLVVKLFSRCFSCLSPISAIKPQHRDGVFSFFSLFALSICHLLMKTL